MLAADSPEVLERFNSQLELVKIIAGQVARTLGAHIDFDDLMSGGREGLLDAARRYDPERGIPFRMYANYRVRGAMLDTVRKMSSLSRRGYERLLQLEAASQAAEGEAAAAVARTSSTTSDGDVESALGDHVATMATAAAFALARPRRSSDSADSDTIAEIAAESDPEQDYERAELVALLSKGIAELPPEEAALLKRRYIDGQALEDAAAALNISGSWARRLHARGVERLSKRLRGQA